MPPASEWPVNTSRVTCVEIKFRTPNAIDATSSPQLDLLDGVEVHEGLGNNSQDFHTDTGSRGPISKTGFTLSGDGPTAGSSAMPPLMTCA